MGEEEDGWVALEGERVLEAEFLLLIWRALVVRACEGNRFAWAGFYT